MSVSHRVSVFLLLSGWDPLECQQATDNLKVSDGSVLQNEVVASLSVFLTRILNLKKHCELARRLLVYCWD